MHFVYISAAIIPAILILIYAYKQDSFPEPPRIVFKTFLFGCATILGIDQWKWFENQLKDEFDFLFIFSSIQIIAENHRFEKWSNFPYERDKFFNSIEQFKDKTVLFSGDRHRAGIYKKGEIIEITSSSMNKPGSSFDETDKYLVGVTYPEVNYSILEIFEKRISLKIKDIDGNTLNSIELELNH